MKRATATRLRHNLERLRKLRGSSAGKILFVRDSISVGALLALRLALVLFLFGVALLLFYLDRAGIKDNLDGVMSFTDVVYFTVVTVTSVGYGDIVPVTDSARMLDALFITPIRVTVWFVFIGTAYQLVIQRFMEGWRMQRLQRRLMGHVVVCGYSNSGRSAVSELICEGTSPEQIVVIERDHVLLQQAIERGVVGLHGDATREEMLLVAGADRARGIIVGVTGDDAALMIVVTARAIGSKARIVADVHESENVKLLRNAGADVTVTSWTYGGYLLADGISQNHTVDLIQDALSHEGEMRLRERAPRPDEVGQFGRELPRALLYAVVRNGRRVMFWEEPRLRIESTDLLIVMDSTAAPG